MSIVLPYIIILSCIINFEYIAVVIVVLVVVDGQGGKTSSPVILRPSLNFFIFVTINVTDQNSTSPKVQGLISRVRLLKMFSLYEVLFIATKRVCLQNIELKYQKLSLFWKARNRFSALPC